MSKWTEQVWSPSSEPTRTGLSGAPRSEAVEELYRRFDLSPPSPVLDQKVLPNFLPSRHVPSSPREINLVHNGGEDLRYGVDTQYSPNFLLRRNVPCSPQGSNSIRNEGEGLRYGVDTPYSPPNLGSEDTYSPSPPSPMSMTLSSTERQADSESFTESGNLGKESTPSTVVTRDTSHAVEIKETIAHRDQAEPRGGLPLTPSVEDAKETAPSDILRSARVRFWILESENKSSWLRKLCPLSKSAPNPAQYLGLHPPPQP